MTPENKIWIGWPEGADNKTTGWANLTRIWPKVWQKLTSSIDTVDTLKHLTTQLNEVPPSELHVFAGLCLHPLRSEAFDTRCVPLHTPVAPWSITESTSWVGCDKKLKSLIKSLTILNSVLSQPVDKSWHLSIKFEQADLKELKIKQLVEQIWPQIDQ